MSHPFVEPLEARALLAAPAAYAPSFTERESNNRERTANALPASYDGVVYAHGSLTSDDDPRDVFRFDAWHDGKVKLSIHQSGQAPARFRVVDARGTRLVDDTDDPSKFDARKGRAYFIHVSRDDDADDGDGDGDARYRLLLRQGGLNVERSRLDALGAGVNVPSWFWNQYDAPDRAQAFADYFTEDDARQLRSIGVRHVRLPVDTGFFVDDWRRPSNLNRGAVAALDRAIGLLLKHDLAVIVSPFGDYNDRVVYGNNDAQVLGFVKAWAGHLARFDARRVFLQTANEPAGDPSRWLPMQAKVVEQMRRKAPDHTIVTATTLRHGPSAGDFGTIEALVDSEPLRDPNVVYGFHFYQPYVFTAQGEEWAWQGYGQLKGVPYPSSPEALAPVIDELAGRLADPDLYYLIQTLQAYGEARWDARRIVEEYAVVKRWADRHGVPVINDEFGTIAGDFVDDADRARWIRDVRLANEQLGFGWTMWDYSAGYNLADGAWGKRTLRPEIVAALGL